MKMLTKNNFDETIKTGLKLIVFSADWCGPCKALTPIVENIEKDIKDLLVFKVDIDEDPELAKKFKVRSVPTIIVFKDGEIHNQTVGLTTKDKLLKMLNE